MSVIVMDLRKINTRMRNNDLEVVYSIRCSSEERAQETLALLKLVQPYTVGDRDGIPDELVMRMNKSPIANLWRLARKLDDDMALLDVRIEAEQPALYGDDKGEDVIDMVYNHTTIYSAGDWGYP